MPSASEARADEQGDAADDRQADQAQEAAIAWMVELRSGELETDAHQAFERWLAADAAHQCAWDRLNGAVAHTLGDLPATAMPLPGQRALVVETTLSQAGRRASGRRRLLRSALALASVGAGFGWLTPRLGRQLGVIPDLYADLSTGTAQRRRMTLPDGSQMLLDARSSVDLDFSKGRRMVHLRQGQLIVSVQPGQTAPFIVQTAQGRAQALGTRYLVRQSAGASWVEVLEHRVLVSTRQGRTHVLEAGQGARLGDEDLDVSDVNPAHSGAWARGLFIADDQPLAELIQALRPYHAGLIRLTPQAAHLRLTGRYVLDDVPATLRALADTLPVDIQRQAAGWLIRIETKN